VNTLDDRMFRFKNFNLLFVHTEYTSNMAALFYPQFSYVTASHHGEQLNEDEIIWSTCQHLDATTLKRHWTSGRPAAELGRCTVYAQQEWPAPTTSSREWW